MAEFFAFDRHPGHLYVIATLLPAVSFLLLLLTAGLRSYLRRTSGSGGFGETLYRLLGGDAPGRGGAYVATAAIVLAFGCALAGLIQHTHEHNLLEGSEEQYKELGRQQKEQRSELTAAKLTDAQRTALEKKLTATAEKRANLHEEIDEQEEQYEARWSGQITWASIHPSGAADPGTATALHLGFHIDTLATLMFLMVTFVASLIHIYSIGYMSAELAPEVEDHEVHTEHGPLRRRGRFPQFFMFLSLFCFSMLNLILADNLFQVFVSWELVGICSYLLIGFYHERQSASNAANKAFITNRVGDAGFVIGLLILWTYVGTFDFQELFRRVRAPEEDAHHAKLELGGQIVRGDVVEKSEGQDLQLAPDGGQVLLFPRKGHLHAHDLTRLFRAEGSTKTTARVIENVSAAPRRNQFGSMPYWLLVAAGLGIFLGCVGKSAQFPLQVWLPDAMEGPTPVSALIHAATMVAAGVYLVGRCYPFFAPETLLVIAYTGGITLFVAATVALVMTDIKKVLAYSTVSQLGYMMLGLGVGGWTAGLFHLLTHAFFKALLFLCSGSVIYGCHHVQEMTRMGGLFPKMRITALTMLVGVLAIAGTPFFTGWYSKDAIIASALGFSYVHREHALLFLLPLLTAGITTFYMFRMWFLTFTGKPREERVYEHAHESPPVMTIPLILLAVCALAVAWGWPVWDAEASWLEHHLHHAQPLAVQADFGPAVKAGEFFEQPGVTAQAQAHHHLAGNLALGMAFLGFLFAGAIYYRHALDPAEAKEQFAQAFRFLWHKWYFDELYSAIVVRPALVVSRWCQWFDLNAIDGILHSTARATMGLSRSSGWNDLRIVDGLANLTGNVCYAVGNRLRNLQTGYIRSYILFLVLAAIAIWVILSLALAAPAAPR